MVSLTALWLPILVAAVIVFIAGAVINIVLPYHRTDVARLPDEDAVRDAAQGLARNQYRFPYATPAEMKDPAYQEKLNAGPVGILIVGPPGNTMPKQLALHFVYVLVISLIAGYMGTAAALPEGEAYLEIFQVVGTAAFLGYSGALFLNSNWYHMPWSVTLKHGFDGLIYALLTAGVFGWLWP